MMLKIVSPASFRQQIQPSLDREILWLVRACWVGLGALVLLLGLNTGSASAEWVALDESDSGTAVYIDPDTMLVKGNLVKIWVLYNYRTVHAVAGEPYFSSKVQDEHDCKQVRHRTLVDLRFSSSMGFGKVVSNESQQGKWEPVEPKSLAQRVWRFACSKH